MKPHKRLLLTTLIALLWVSMAAAQEKAVQPEQLGEVHFPVSCSAAAQQQFDRAVALLHSFFFPETVKAFTVVTETDPTCAMGYWGLAMSQRTNPLILPLDVATLKQGWEAVEKAKAAGPKTPREQDYIMAMEAYYQNPEQGGYRQRVAAYERAMEQLYLRYPDDPEAAIFYALAMNEAVDHSDKTYARQLKAGAILEQVFAQQPDHPGVAHYIIHTYDFAPLAPRGLPAARRYAEIAPSSPHALHMPSHIFSMLGLWQESIQANLASTASAKAYTAKHLQGAQDQQARRIVDERNAIEKVTPVRLPNDTAYAAIPVRYAIERGQWSEAAALEIHPSQYPQAEAIMQFGRALGASRSGDIAKARQAMDRLQALRDALTQSNERYWAEQVEIQRRAAAAWMTHAEGKPEEALQLMRQAADLEDASEKHIAMENRLVPMRELLGEMLIELNKPAEALREFEASLQSSPNRLRSFYGAAKSAERAGDLQKTKTFYEQLVGLCSQADTERPELLEAKAFLAKK
jgi:tetratricopeptide (TPR) repeat protein